tara:strand:+ start:40302 stop:44213 length:3912 start_codon:yes stop_codon:yes gene_type:complete
VKKRIFILFILSISLYIKGISQLSFVPNKGQWHKNVQYQAEIPGGKLFIENGAFTYLFFDLNDINKVHEAHHSNRKKLKSTPLVKAHAYQMQLINTSETITFSPSKKHKDYLNFYYGDNPENWAVNLPKYQALKINNVYPGIDLKWYQHNNALKYDFIVHPSANINQIKIKLNGIEKGNFFIDKKGNLHIKTSVNEVIEQAPYAFQEINGKIKKVKCHYVLQNDTLSFQINGRYSKNHPVIIDPLLIFASYTGSSSDNWGYTSTFDQYGNTYSGGVAFGSLYPTTLGAFQVNFAGGNGQTGTGGTYSVGTDIVISKFSADGSTLLYSTYLGGSDNESPHSIIVDNNDNLIVMGTTSSSDFPVANNAFDQTYGGGSPVSGIPSYLNGSDIILSKFNPNGTALIGSTYIGGSGNDGLNTPNALDYNYADEFRGEVIIDANDNIYVGSCTSSSDFPVTTGAYQTSLTGLQDGCIFKLSPDLSTMIWSSYFGGSNNDAIYSVQLNSTGNPYFAGGTNSSDLPVSANALNTSFSGTVDGFVAEFNPAGSTLLASTYIGTPQYDQCYFVQLDTNDNVHVVGQTTGNYPITPATVYNVPNSGQFLHELSPDLSSTIMSTSFGRGAGTVDIALSAFLVNDCNYIFISGWGGVVNSAYSQATNSTTNGLPVTPNALQTSTDGSDYYLMVLTQDADSLLFATYFGGAFSNDHVDGGTSRFDKKGIVYQAVCAGCGGYSDFPTTPGVWSQSNNSSNCNLSVFKIDLSQLTADVELYSDPYFCLGDTVFFRNLSNGGDMFEWDFGDGNSSTQFEPSHVYAQPGNYNVMLVAYDSLSCTFTDTDYVMVYVYPPPSANVQNAPTICKGDSIQLFASGGVSYQWLPDSLVNNDTIANPWAYPQQTTTFTVIAIDSCGQDTAYVTINVSEINATVSDTTTICIGDSAQIQATGGVSYVWTPNYNIINANSSSPTVFPASDTTYFVSITNADGCTLDTLVFVKVDTSLPQPQITPDTLICKGSSIELSTTDGTSYQWTPSSGLNNPNIANPVATPTNETTYYVAVSNYCGTVIDSVHISLHEAVITARPDTIVCPNTEIPLYAFGGEHYAWYPAIIVGYNQNGFYAIPQQPQFIYVNGTDSMGCSATDSFYVDFYPPPFVDAGEDVWLVTDSTTLQAQGNGIFVWQPSALVTCDTCQQTIAFPNLTTTFTVTLTDSLGCTNSDDVTVFVNSNIWVPNAFTPDGDGTNDYFSVKTFRIKELTWYIFDRWGEEIFKGESLDSKWDGTYMGKLVKQDVYVYKIYYTDIQGVSGYLYGTVTLLR